MVFTMLVATNNQKEIILIFNFALEIFYQKRKKNALTSVDNTYEEVKRKTKSFPAKIIIKKKSKKCINKTEFNRKSK